MSPNINFHCNIFTIKCCDINSSKKGYSAPACAILFASKAPCNADDTLNICMMWLIHIQFIFFTITPWYIYIYIWKYKTKSIIQIFFTIKIHHNKSNILNENKQLIPSVIQNPQRGGNLKRNFGMSVGSAYNVYANQSLLSILL